MFLKWNKLYIFLFITCLAGYIWIFIAMEFGINRNSQTSVCLMKQITNIPCPSCGSTRAVISLIRGEFLNSLCINPFGLVIAVFMIVAPFWMIYDVITSKNSFIRFYRKLENLVRKKKIAILLIALILLNWIWNINKGL
jgi:hypothetical protein